MKFQEKQAYYEAIYRRYQQVNRGEKSRILDELCQRLGISGD